MRASIAAAVAFLFSLPALAEPLPFQPVPPVHSSTVMINDGCTGWYIGNDLIVTAGHCLKGGKVPQVRYSNGKTGSAGIRYLADVNEGGDDFAVLTIKIKPWGFIRPMHIDCGASPQIGTDVYMTGYPGGLEAGIGQFTALGKVAGSATKPFNLWPSVIPVNISAYGGFSGSAVRRISDDMVVGILVGAVPGARDIAFMVPMQKLCGLLGVA